MKIIEEEYETNINNSGVSGYTDFTTTEAALRAGYPVDVALTPGTSSYIEALRIWIDLNGDNDFEDPGELVFAGSNYGELTGQFTALASAEGLTTSLRVSMRYRDTPPVCGEFDYHEVEDYTVTFRN